MRRYGALGSVNSESRAAGWRVQFHISDFGFEMHESTNLKILIYQVL